MSWNWTPNETATRPPLLCSIVSLESPPTRCQSRAPSCYSWCDAPFRALWGTGCSSEPGLTEHSHHIHNQSKTVMWMRFLRLCFLLSLRKIVTPHYKSDVVIKLIRSNTVSEEVRKHSKWHFSAEISYRRQIISRFLSIWQGNTPHSSHTHMRNCIREQRKGNTNAGKKI